MNKTQQKIIEMLVALEVGYSIMRELEKNDGNK